ncbi:hypothetical protein [uncultured Rhodospira sp.]|uniref:phage head-tail joining protein n=1 Tax=uncultured Rhodospira sp. TaxID=1936189 RepID=UPI002619DDDF|nr:hypothetical protein [uncultured Rhodospira sp.]
MATQEELIARRDALQVAIDSGIREVTNPDGKSIVYRSQRDMLDALARLNERIGSSSRVSKIVISSTKGL